LLTDAGHAQNFGVDHVFVLSKSCGNDKTHLVVTTCSLVGNFKWCQELFVFFLYFVAMGQRKTAVCGGSAMGRP
jgi:hypothetical protein